MEIIYLSGPYSSNPELNTKTAIKEAMKLIKRGYLVIIPHLMKYCDEEDPQDYEFWLNYVCKWIPRCGVLIRLDGHSPGAEKEVEIAKQLKKPIYKSVEDFLERKKNKSEK